VVEGDREANLENLEIMIKSLLQIALRKDLWRNQSPHKKDKYLNSLEIDFTIPTLTVKNPIIAIKLQTATMTKGQIILKVTRQLLFIKRNQ
jgi:hypothetical protein